MRKIIILCLSLVCLLLTVSVNADEENSETIKTLVRLNIMNENGFSNNNAVSREECLISIMRAIGLTDKEVNLLDGADFYAFADTAPYSYFGCAYRAKIAYGEECIVNYPTYRTSHTGKNTDFFFFPERPATVKETLAFMVRCLDSSKIDFNHTVKTAKEYGLVKDEESFIKEPDSVIDKNGLCILLERFLNQKRYKYYQREDNLFKMEGNIDDSQSLTYLQFLTREMGCQGDGSLDTPSTPNDKVSVEPSL